MVFFAVGLSKNLTVAYDKHVLFDKVFVNYRGAYNVTSGQLNKTKRKLKTLPSITFEAEH